MRLRDAPDQSHTVPGAEDLIFHATFKVLDTVIMATDVGYQGPESKPNFDGFSLLLQMKSAELAEGVFSALSDQVQVLVPFAQSKFTSWYGFVIDRFGVSWKLNVDSSSK
ncbi:MAG: VOC family protein [Aureliella sp.]